jgi:hypothetical protein
MRCQVHYCECGEEIFDDMEICAGCESTRPLAAPPGPSLETSDVRWEYEDQLPEMNDADFDAIFKASRVDGVRMYPFVEDSNGNRIWITHLPERT